MRKQVSLSQLFTQTKLESIMFHSKYLVFNILKIQDTNPSLKNASSLLLNCKNTFDHFFIFYFFTNSNALKRSPKPPGLIRGLILAASFKYLS
ncbi:hypothetical protein D8X56_04235 [Helicobacter pylori]|nr:hypothetical protein D8X56_04235 [Helicobacter pylori]